MSNPGPILDNGGMGAFFEDPYSETQSTNLTRKNPYPKKMSFLTISIKNIFYKNQDTRLRTIVPPNRDIE